MNKLNETFTNLYQVLSTIEAKDWYRARTVQPTRFDAMIRAITDPRKKHGRSLALYFYRKFVYNDVRDEYLSELDVTDDVRNQLRNLTVEYLIRDYSYDTHLPLEPTTYATFQQLINERAQLRNAANNNEQENNNGQRRTGFTFNEDVDLNEEDLEETYSEEELKDFVGKTFNQQKIQNIYRRTKYNDSRLYAHTKCTKCGREKRVFLSNLVNDPEKYGSCVCSDANLDGKYDKVQGYYDGSKKLSNNTSGFTGVSKVKTKTGNKWRAYIDTDGERKYLGDFTVKSKAIDARKQAAEKGIKWYKEHKNQFKNKARRKAKRYKSKRFGNKK